MRININKVFLCFLGLSLMFVPISFAEQTPIDILHENIDKVIAVLRDPLYKDASKQQDQKDKLWKAIGDFFDFKKISMLSIGRNWKKFTPEQQNEFIGLFTKVLGNTYLDKLQSEFKDEKVVYLSEDIYPNGKVRVKTHVVRENAEIPMDYSMYSSKKGWKIYDIKIEGVSLVGNYRSQFGKLLSKNSPEELIKKLQQKVEDIQTKKE